MSEIIKKPALGFENIGCTSDGKIFSTTEKKYIEIEESPNGFPCVMLDGAWRNARNVIWEAFNGKLKENQKVTVKKGGNKMDCSLGNLEVFEVKKDLTPQDFYDILAEIRDLLKNREAGKQPDQGNPIDDEVFTLQ